MTSTGNILLITGKPGIGKTTVIKKVVNALSDRRINGFYTEEIRVHNVRRGFALIPLEGKPLVMAHVDSDSAYRVGKYGVDVNAIDAAVAMTLADERQADVFIVDEIGKMECFSDLFVQRMSFLLDSDNPVVATVALKGGGFIAEVKKRTDAVLWEVTRKNRDEIPARIVAWVRERLA